MMSPIVLNHQDLPQTPNFKNMNTRVRWSLRSKTGVIDEEYMFATYAQKFIPDSAAYKFIF